jgi:transcriptional regulator with XRE-family HTH domain
MKELGEIFFGGVSDKTVSRYLAGEVEPPPTVLSKLAKNLNCNLDWLLIGEGEAYNNYETLARAQEAMASIVARLMRMQAEAVRNPETAAKFLLAMQDINTILADVENARPDQNAGLWEAAG